MNSTHVQYSSLYFTRSDKEGSPHFVELMAKEGDTTDQEEDSSQSWDQPEDYQHGPKTSKHCKKHSKATIRAVDLSIYTGH